METKYKVLTSLILLIIGFSIVLTTNNTEEIIEENNFKKSLETISLSEWKSINDNDKTFEIIDVRTPEEYTEKKIPNTQLIDFYNPNFKQDLDKLDKNKNYLIHCRSGARSANALSVMQELGFKNVKDLAGGINAWNKAGYKTN